MKKTEESNVLQLILWILSLPLMIAGIIIDLCLLDKFRRKRNEKLMMKIKNGQWVKSVDLNLTSGRKKSERIDIIIEKIPKNRQNPQRDDSINRFDPLPKNEGKDIIGEITAFNHYDDPDDDEYTVIEFRIKFQIGSETIYKESKFSMNTTHIDYAYHGLMYDTPKTKYSVSDFYNAMKPGNKIRIRALLKPPHEYVIVGNEVINEVIHEMLDSDTVRN